MAKISAFALAITDLLLDNGEKIAKTCLTGLLSVVVAGIFLSSYHESEKERIVREATREQLASTATIYFGKRGQSIFQQSDVYDELDRIPKKYRNASGETLLGNRSSPLVDRSIEQAQEAERRRALEEKGQGFFQRILTRGANQGYFSATVSTIGESVDRFLNSYIKEKESERIENAG